MKRQPTDWEKIRAYDVTNRELLSQIYKPLMILNSIKTNNPIKKWAGGRVKMAMREDTESVSCQAQDTHQVLVGDLWQTGCRRSLEGNLVLGKGKWGRLKLGDQRLRGCWGTGRDLGSKNSSGAGMVLVPWAPVETCLHSQKREESPGIGGSTEGNLWGSLSLSQVD